MLDFILHIDQHLLDFIGTHGFWVYGLLFAIVFAETGCVVTPFLPGDSLLFATGALAAIGALNPWIAFALLVVAAVTGDITNYAIGRVVGPRIFSASDRVGISNRLFNRQHLARAHDFFLKHGGNAVTLARFVPIVRTFVPFVAGAAAMPWHAFMFFNIVGAIAWVGICLAAGILFGNVPIVKNNFSLVTVGIVLVSLLPILIEYLRHRQRRAIG